MVGDQHTVETQLHSNMLLINAAIDSKDVRRFKLLAKRRHSLWTELHSYGRPCGGESCPTCTSSLVAT